MEKHRHHNLQVKEVFPGPPLRPYIRKYYLFDDERDGSLNGDHAFYALPNGLVEMLLLFDGKQVIVHQEGRAVGLSGFIAGIQELDQSVNMYYKLNDRHYSGIGILFTHDGVNKLLGCCLYELTNRIHGLQGILQGGADWLRDHVQNGGNADLRLKRLDDFFMCRLNASGIATQRIIPLLGALEQMNGPLSVDKTAAHLGLSYKTLYRMFTAGLGMSPKAYLKILRFDRACRMLDQYSNINETDIVHHCGYYDQAHFIHEFKKVMKVSPREYMRYSQGKAYFNRPFAIRQNVKGMV